MKSNNSEIKSLVKDIVVSAKNTFSKNDIAVYIMGSLARGGFSEVSSDIDLGIVLNGSLDNVGAKIKRILSTAHENYPSVKNNISVFWGSIESINGVIDAGRYPPFDRLDLIDHALLLSGKDIRKMLVRPTKKELEIASASFSLGYLGNQERIEEFHNCERIVEKGVVYVTKTILFPARFIYLEKTGKIAGNDVSYQYYLNNFSGSDAKLIEHGYFWRLKSLPEELDIVTELLKNGLVILYSNFIDIYLKSMDSYGEYALKNELTQWRNNITS
ncbi:MAG: nucleotidyltransferase domain-containing protein [Nitrosomonadales bacterium]|nr:MAG: nucleotidyltransferase domain-containing protein [Nitrosomonadales bacterium]